MTNFEGLKHLVPHSNDFNWGDPNKLDLQLLLKLDSFAEQCGGRVVVTSAYRPASDGSQHKVGKAADVMVIGTKLRLIDLYHLAERCGFQGIGIYPAWRYNGTILGGLHVDVRDTTGPHAKWMGIAVGTKQIYIGLTNENLTKYGVV